MPNSKEKWRLAAGPRMTSGVEAAAGALAGSSKSKMLAKIEEQLDEHHSDALKQESAEMKAERMWVFFSFAPNNDATEVAALGSVPFERNLRGHHLAFILPTLLRTVTRFTSEA